MARTDIAVVLRFDDLEEVDIVSEALRAYHATSAAGENKKKSLREDLKTLRERMIEVKDLEEMRNDSREN